LPPLPRDTDRTVSEIRNDVIKTRAIVSELEYSVTSTHTMISDIHRTTLKTQEGSDGKDLSVSDTRTISAAEYVLTVVQTQTRSASSTTG